MQLGPKTAEFIKRQSEMEEAPTLPPFSEKTIQVYRDYNIALFQEWAGAFPEGYSTESFTDRSFLLSNKIEINTKIITPPGYDAAKHATVIFFQGNGMVFDMLEAHLPGYVRVALAGCCKVIGVDTPLAPAHSAQTINESVYELVTIINRDANSLDINPNSIMLAGYSGGGNLVANMCATSRTDENLNIKHVFLLSPSLDLTLKTRIHSPFKQYQDRDLPANSAENIKPILEMYYKQNDPTLPLISPLFEPKLDGMPATTIILAEFDACRGDGQAYAVRLKQAHVPVEVLICKGQTHLYFIARGVMGDDPDPANVMGEIIKERL